MPFPINYCNDSYPALSFAYAVYCGRNKEETFMEHENKLVRESIRKLPGFQEGEPPSAAVATHPSVYRGYLTYYKASQRFPSEAQAIVSDEVIQNGEPFWNPAKDLTSPTEDQCMRYALHVVRELRGLPPLLPLTVVADPCPARRNARRDDFRPMLSCLAVIFLNDDLSYRNDPAEFLADYELSPGATAVLTTFGEKLAGLVGPIPQGPWLTENEANALTSELVDDMAKSKLLFPVW